MGYAHQASFDLSYCASSALPAFVFRYIQSLLISPGELSGQVLSFAANTIYMAISCSNLQPKTELSGSSSTGKLAALYSVY